MHILFNKISTKTKTTSQRPSKTWFHVTGGSQSHVCLKNRECINSITEIIVDGNYLNEKKFA